LGKDCLGFDWFWHIKYNLGDFTLMRIPFLTRLLEIKELQLKSEDLKIYGLIQIEKRLKEILKEWKLNTSN